MLFKILPIVKTHKIELSEFCLQRDYLGMWDLNIFQRWKICQYVNVVLSKDIQFTFLFKTFYI